MRDSKFSRGRRAARLAAILLSGLACPLAFAHEGGDGTAHHGLLAGLQHPFTGIDHLAAMLAVGLWSAIAAARARWQDYVRAPVAFTGMLVAGALLASAGMRLPAVEPAIAASLLVLGLLVWQRRALPPAAAASLVGAFALFHGAAHGQELAGPAAWAGMALGTVLLHAAGLAAGHALRRRSAWWPRVAGAATVLLGSALLLG